MTQKKFPAWFTGSLIAFIIFLCQSAESSQINIVTTIPDLAEVARKVGGNEVTVSSLLSGKEDPHYADAAPNFVLRVAVADVVCAVGLELEVGWLPKVLAKSGNAKVQKGGRGFCEVGENIKTLDIPKGQVDRSMGHVHRQGNPHFNLSPKALAEGAAHISGILSSLRPEKAALFTDNLKRFEDEMATLQGKVASLLKPAVELSKSQPVSIQYHQEFRYFFELYGINSLGSIEEKPGVPPSASRLAEIATQAKSKGVKIALAAQFAPEKQLQRFSELSGVPIKRVPALVQNTGNLDTIEKVQMEIANAISNALMPQNNGRNNSN